MDLNLLKIFKKVADTGSLTKAAKYLGVPKSKVSRDLTKLEDFLAANLLLRSPKGVVLTEEGIKLLKLIRPNLEGLDGARDEFLNRSEDKKGVIRLTAPEDLSNHILADLVFDFMEQHPKVEIDLISTNTFLDFQERKIDLALRIGKLQDSSLIQRKIADIDVIFTATPRFLKSRPPILALEDLRGEPLALIKDINSKLFKMLEPSFSSNSIPLVKEFAVQSRGVAAAPRFFCEEELKSKMLVEALPGEVFAQRGLYMLSHPSKRIPLKVKLFKNFVFDSLRARL